MNMVSTHINNKLMLLPDLPGCYLMKNKEKEIIYIGKAKNLKNRVRSYFRGTHEGKTQLLVEEIVDFETIITSTDKECLLLEITLIKKHQPKYNIKLKQGTSYPYLKITNEKDPQLIITSEVKRDGGHYFGPYPNVYAASETQQFIQKVYPLRKCNGHQKRACLYYHLGQCIGPCDHEVPKEEYDAQVDKIRRFLNGDVKEIKKIFQEPVLATDIEELPLIMFPSGFYGRELLDSWAKSQKITLNPIMEISSAMSQFQLAEKGIGMTIQPQQLKNEIIHQNIVALEIEHPPIREVVITYMKNKYLTKAMVDFMERLSFLF